ncbi:MAG: PUA domain-containing protein [Promethearchaeota archaeon]
MTLIHHYSSDLARKRPVFLWDRLHYEYMGAITIKQRAFLNKKRIKSLVGELRARYGDAIDSIMTKDVEEGKLNTGGVVLIINKNVSFFKLNEKDEIWIPFRDVAQDLQIKKITIDQPAVPYIVDGADVMRPGIVDIEDGIAQGEIVSIIDEKNKITLAIGIAKLNTEDMKAATKGKIVKNIHHAGDKYWNLKSQV